MAKKQKSPMDEIVDELVVFKIEGRTQDKGYISNSNWWQDSRVRTLWLNKFAAEDTNADGEVDEQDEDELPAYETLSNDELRAELSARKLSIDGKKVDMIQRLEADDSKG